MAFAQMILQWLRVSPARSVPCQTAVRRGNSTDDSGLATGLIQVLRDCGRLYRRRVNQHLNSLIQCLCTDFPHAVQGCEETRDTLRTFLTIETQVADDFETHGFEHS